MRRLAPRIAVIAGLCGFTAAQFGSTHDGRNPGQLPQHSIGRVIRLPLAVKAVIEESCRDCHSHATRWPWYSHLPLVGGLLERDVFKARMRLNFSDWRVDLSAEDALARLEGICEGVLMRQMPPSYYLALHPQARLSDQEIQSLCAWTASEQKKILLTRR